MKRIAAPMVGGVVTSAILEWKCCNFAGVL